MSEAVLRRIGEPFFSTRAGAEGTGLGVSMVHAFVRQSGGTMQVQSGEGAGSTFRLLFPAAPGAVDAQRSLPLDAGVLSSAPSAPASN